MLRTGATKQLNDYFADKKFNRLDGILAQAIRCGNARKTFFEIFFVAAVARKHFLHKDQFFVAALVQLPDCVCRKLKGWLRNFCSRRALSIHSAQAVSNF
jgi:hypothetical protein